MLSSLPLRFHKLTSPMPLYEYHCAKCGRFETLQKFSDSHLSVCPTCGSTVDRLISAPAFQFKGSGWYVTDYGKSGSDKPVSKDAGSKGSDSKSSGDSTSSSEASTPPSADSKSSTNSSPKEGTASAAPALAPPANTNQ